MKLHIKTWPYVGVALSQLLFSSYQAPHYFLHIGERLLWDKGKQEECARLDMSFLPSLASKRALFTTASKDSHSRRLEWWDGSKCSRLWRMDSSWTETGERLTWKTEQLPSQHGWFQAKWVNFAIVWSCTPCEGLLTLLKRDEKTSWWSFMFIPSHILNNSSSSSILNSSNVSHWISRSSSSMSLQYYSIHFHWRALH